MEPITAMVLFAGIVVSWFFLPSAPPAEQAGHGAAAGVPSKA